MDLERREIIAAQITITAAAAHATVYGLGARTEPYGRRCAGKLIRPGGPPVPALSEVLPELHLALQLRAGRQWTEAVLRVHARHDVIAD